MTLMLTSEKRPIADEQSKEVEEGEDTHREKLARKSSKPRSLLKIERPMPTSTRCRSYHLLESQPRREQVKRQRDSSVRGSREGENTHLAFDVADEKFHFFWCILGLSISFSMKESKF
jgi:hypothetical protein